MKKDEALLTTNELAKRWKMSAGSLENWRRSGKGPSFVKFGKGAHAIVRYRLFDIQKYESKFIVHSRRKK